MEFKYVVSSFRHIEKFYDIFCQFDRSIVKTRYLILFSRVFNFLKLHYIFILLSFLFKPKKLQGELVGFVFTENQKNSLRVLKKTGINFPVYFFNYVKDDQDLGVENRIVSDFIIFLNILSTDNLHVLVKEFSKIDRLSNNNIRVLKLIGIYRVYIHLLKGIKSMVNFNDHAPYNVLLADISKEKKIHTIYIQHAPVTEKFPALYHDTNILYSQDSLDKYRISDENAKIILGFDFRLFNAVNNKTNIKLTDSSVLICPNDLDSLEKTTKLVNLLILEGFNVIVRPHPIDKRNWKSLVGCEISKRKSIWEDFDLSEKIVTNESAVPIEAIFYNKKVYKASFLSSSLDHYGFIKKNLILREHDSFESLVHAIKNDLIEFDISKLPYFIGDFENGKQKITSFFKSIKSN